MAYDGRPLWEDQLDPRFDSATGQYELITHNRFVFVDSNFCISHNPQTPHMHVGIALEDDSRRGRQNRADFLAEQIEYAPRAGSATAVAVRIMGTKRVEMASVGKRGDFIKSDSLGRGVVTTNPKEAIAQLKEDAVYGGYSLVMIGFSVSGAVASTGTGTGGNTGGNTGGGTDGNTGGGTDNPVYGEDYPSGETDFSDDSLHGWTSSQSGGR